ncbi:Mss4-like protein [Paraphoma chrysanthemicola]|uniref:Mss4-like protein n=1 Tax=Paraphoma chrysanthemicola TaxID=798071 RepID=A0A8K0R7M0_9PLEO|nr:Mss4-like protein [Paraphoma chrysanthemicola]
MSDEELKKAFLAQLPVFNPADAETCKATCHCGAIRFSVTLSPPLKRHPVGLCNCSICMKNGYLLVYPTRERVVIKCGEEHLKVHTFGTHRNLHKFCAKCGSSVFFDPQLTSSEGDPDLIGINIRMFQGITLDGLNIYTFDGYHARPFLGDASHLQPPSGN